MNCTKCGAPDANPSGYSKCKERQLMEDHGWCFGCAFWGVHKQNYTGHFVADGTCYFIGPEEPSSIRGFGGRKFRVVFHDGRDPVITTNLWHNGEIPAVWRSEFPDDATLTTVY